MLQTPAPQHAIFETVDVNKIRNSEKTNPTSATYQLCWVFEAVDLWFSSQNGTKQNRFTEQSPDEELLNAMLLSYKAMVVAYCLTADDGKVVVTILDMNDNRG